MSLEIKPKYSASLTFRGFEMAPKDVEALIGLKSSALGLRGEPIRKGMNPLNKSFVQYEIIFENSTNLFEMVPTLLTNIGGVEKLVNLKDEILPENIEVDLTLRIKESKEQEGGFIDIPTLESLIRLQATLSFQFLESNRNA